MARVERAAERASGSRVRGGEHAELDPVRRPDLVVAAVRAARPGRQARRTSAEAPATEAAVERTARRRLQRHRGDCHLHIDTTLAEALHVLTHRCVVAAAEDLGALTTAATGDEQSGDAQDQRGSSPQRRVTNRHTRHNRTLANQRVTNARPLYVARAARGSFRDTGPGGCYLSRLSVPFGVSDLAPISNAGRTRLCRRRPCLRRRRVRGCWRRWCRSSSRRTQWLTGPRKDGRCYLSAAVVGGHPMDTR